MSLAQTPVATGEQKDKMVAGLLGIFLGTFGVHNFYLGYKRNALIQCIGSAVGIVFACFFFPIFITCGMGIWGLVEGIFILTGKIDKDANGNLNFHARGLHSSSVEDPQIKDSQIYGVVKFKSKILIKDF